MFLWSPDQKTRALIIIITTTATIISDVIDLSYTTQKMWVTEKLRSLIREPDL